MKCCDPTIDGLLAVEASIANLTTGAKGCAVEYLQDLLRGHGYDFLPDPRVPWYGMYGLSTSHAVTDYRRKNGLPAADCADSALLRDLVQRTAPNAALNPAYAPLVMNVPFTPITRFVWLTSLFETGGAFGTLNLNTDQCGVSFGILQWSQKPGQLHKLLLACSTREPAEWARIIGGTAILDHTSKPNGGVDASGISIEPGFELTKDPWKSRLLALGASPAMQRVQLELASDAYLNELTAITASAPEIRSERGLAFLLDLANQFGPGRIALHYKAAAQPGTTEPEILKQLENAFTNLARPQFQPQVRARREFFRTTPLLSDDPFTIPVNRS
jgi:peptidoglycan hydrolase-like protein with peptidoglycan-binding domain